MGLHIIYLNNATLRDSFGLIVACLTCPLRPITVNRDISLSICDAIRTGTRVSVRIEKSVSRHLWRHLQAAQAEFCLSSSVTSQTVSLPRWSNWGSVKGNFIQHIFIDFKCVNWDHAKCNTLYTFIYVFQTSEEVSTTHLTFSRKSMKRCVILAYHTLPQWLSAPLQTTS